MYYCYAKNPLNFGFDPLKVAKWLLILDFHNVLRTSRYLSHGGDRLVVIAHSKYALGESISQKLMTNKW